jgi:hypothetical protein
MTPAPILFRSRAPLVEEAQRLARFRCHIAHLEDLYREQCAAFAKRALSRAGLGECLTVVAVDTEDDDVIIQLSFKG